MTDDEWQGRIDSLFKVAARCELCPRKCHVDRTADQKGFCGTPGEMIISSIFPHHGEEPPISGVNGSGTVFFSYCTLKCCFCQNYQISHEYEGKPYSVYELAQEMINLQNKGCHNINLVTATHFLPWILQSLQIASQKGLNIPIVYNCSGYELPSIISILNGIVDIYLPDMKYGESDSAIKYSKAEDYVEINREAVKTMFRQVGPLKTDDNGIAYRGMCIRHLVLPDNKAHSIDILNYLCSIFDPSDIFISLMAQYRPLYNAKNFNEINRVLTVDEYEPVKTEFVNAGFQGFFQEIENMDQGFLIDFKKRKTEALTGE